jgi:hypothetical protein
MAIPLWKCEPKPGQKGQARANFCRYKQNDSGRQLITHVGFLI